VRAVLAEVMLSFPRPYRDAKASALRRFPRWRSYKNMRSHCFTDIATRSVFCASSETTYRHRGLANAERPAALRPVRVRRTDRDNTNSDVTVRQDGGAKKTETPDEATRRNDDRIKCGRRTTIHGPAALLLFHSSWFLWDTLR
jgi:hypothetical protein